MYVRQIMTLCTHAAVLRLYMELIHQLHSTAGSIIKEWFPGDFCVSHWWHQSIKQAISPDSSDAMSSYARQTGPTNWKINYFAEFFIWKLETTCL